MIKLTILTGTDAGKEITPASDPIILGRSSTCTIVLHDAAASRRHSSIERRGTDYVLTDLQSGNGTFVNSPGTRIHAPYTLQDGDEILIGKSRVRIGLFIQAEEDEAAKVPPGCRRAGAESLPEPVGPVDPSTASTNASKTPGFPGPTLVASARPDRAARRAE